MNESTVKRFEPTHPKKKVKSFLSNRKNVILLHIKCVYSLLFLSLFLSAYSISISLQRQDTFAIQERYKRDENGGPGGVPDYQGPEGKMYDSERNVEFIHPKLREEMKMENEDPNNPWVWLTSYSRIPLEAIQDFCAATKEYCPPGREGKKGEVGNPGVIGEKGKRGRAGRPGSKGSRGHRGAIGPPGPRGPKGENGAAGLPGLDGRDGLPGEPGLDGIPGRSGLDGLPGVDGTPGTPGIPGHPGIDGKNGVKGEIGSRGPMGSRGERGITGPRGRSGQNGNDGDPGEPGICVYKVKNSTPSEVIIPPSISGFEDKAHSKSIIVQEGDNLKLTCASSGIPQPRITWNRLDKKSYSNRMSNTVGPVLNITHINRKHMGDYICEANNGIPPVDRKVFHINVYFPPLIRIHQQMIGGYNGSFTVLECTIEAFPSPVNYWERHDGKIIERKFRKYNLHSIDRDKYVTVVRLNVTLNKPEDFGSYYCISKNEKGVTKGAITIFERDPNSALPPPIIGGFRPIVIGEEPPDFVGLEDLCPKTDKCPECTSYPGLRCEGSAKMYGLNILPYDTSLPGLTNRTQDCILETIGKPVFHRYTNDLYGSWMMDAVVRADTEGKIWATSGSVLYNQTLYEFNNKTAYREHKSTRNYTLPLPFTGNDHVIYNGSFYYLHYSTESIIKYNLRTLHSTKLRLPKNRVVLASGLNLLDSLYSSQQKDNYLDLHTDENGLWAIFGLAVDNNTVVAKIEGTSMEIQYMWNISLNHHQVADMFIVCGVLYAVDHVDTKDTRIRFALDLYKNKLLDIELPFTNPFSFTTMLGYNPELQSLTTWDSGNQLTYPIKYIDIGYRDRAEDALKTVDKTGFQIKYNQDSGLQIVDFPQDKG
nr:LOW QUALITY PROTEIN: uncharacterized protein LOC121119077 [Lepeophtheirus salmonis]